jgi:hypothetical protein
MQTNPTGGINPIPAPVTARANAQQQETGALPQDTAEIGSPQPPSPGPIRRFIEGTAGLIGGVGGVLTHLPHGTVEGIAEGVASTKYSQYEYSKTGWYTTVTIGQWTAAGAAAGLVSGGPIGAAIGAGVGLVASLMIRAVEGAAGIPKTFVAEVDKKVDKALEDNQGGTRIKRLIQDATEGAIVGTGAGVKEAWKAGVDVGSGTAAAILDVAGGLKDGVVDYVKDKFRSK